MASEPNLRLTRSLTRKTAVQLEKNPEIKVNSQTRRKTKTELIPEKGAPLEDEKKTVPRTPTKKKSSEASSCESSVTPPKQKRFEAVYQKSAQLTPSTLLGNLTLASPNKGTCEPQDTHELSSRKSLHFSPKTEQENKEKKAVQKHNSRYRNARRALHSQFPTEMPGREKEIAEIRQFIEQHMENHTSGSIYISGAPGTGKTASLNLILEEKKVASHAQKVYVNCTGIKSASAVYSRLITDLRIQASGRSEKDCQTTFEKYLRRKHKPLIIVLDEIDQLESKNHSVLYTIFEWPSRFHSGVILVGISNALDLTDRVLPRLHARYDLKPKLLHFAPYSKEQIVHIFIARLQTEDISEIFNPAALQMLAGKVAAISGDVRRALDIGRRVIEMIDESKKTEDILKSVENFTDDEAILKKVSPEEPKVNLKEVVSVLGNVYGTSQSLVGDNDEAFPLQQKIAVCALLLMLKKAKNKDVTVGKLHEVYTRVCTKRNLTAMDQAEFVGLLSLVETRGIIRVSGRKEPRLHKVSLEWNQSEVSDALRDKQLVSTILEDESCLGRL